jgi:DNA-binding CsgD family transcriptional regulator
VDRGTLRQRVTDPGALVKRQVEIAVLGRLLDHARSSRAQVGIIEGESGMGKSALLEAFVGRRCDNAVIRWSRCDEFLQNRAFGLAGLLLADDGLSNYSEVAVGRRLLSLLGDLQTGHEGLVVLVIDDAQWIDHSSAQALRFALRRLRADRILCLIARRPGYSDLGAVLTEDPTATTALRLGPLSADAVRDLARLLRSWELPIDVAQRLVARTGGVPLLVKSVVRSATDLAQVESGAGVPASAATAASRMLASVGPEPRRLVEAAAVLAEPTDIVVLGRIADLADPSAAVTSAAAAGLVSVDDLGVVDCAHALLSEAIYSGLPPARRRDLHVRAAIWTTGDRQLAHRTAAADRPDPQLVRDLLDAAASARSSLNFGVAAQHRLRARSLSGDPGQRERLLLEALIERVEAQDLSGAEELARSARDASSSAPRSLALGLLARESGQVGEARTLLREALDLATAAGDRTACARAAVALAVLNVRLGEGSAAVDVLAHAENVDDPELWSDALTTKAMGLWQAGELDRGLDLINAVPMSSEGTSWEADMVAVRGMLRMYDGQLPQALADLDAAVRIVHLWRPSTNQSRVYVLRSMARYHLGDWDGAGVDAAAARALAQESSATWSASLALAVSADVPAGRGQWDVAAQHLARAKAALSNLAGVQLIDTVLSHEVAVAVAREDHQAVLDLLEPIWTDEYLHRVAFFRTSRPIMQARIRACIGLDRLVDAEKDLSRYEEMVGRVPRGPIPSRLGWLRGLLAEARGDPRAAQQHYAEDLAEPQTHEVPFVLAQLLHTSGRLERAMGNRREAIDRLTRAREILAGLRAAPFVERASAELAACGLHSPVADPLALTQREQDVVALVERGYTNKEAASELFLTAKTVEYHLRNIFAKLGITSRRELRHRREPSAAMSGEIGWRR